MIWRNYGSGYFISATSRRKVMGPMKTLVIVAALLLGTLATHPAKACDMGAIESWVAPDCKGSACAAKPVAQHPAAVCDGSNCTKLPPIAPKRGCSGSDCAG